MASADASAHESTHGTTTGHAMQSVHAAPVCAGAGTTPLGSAAPAPSAGRRDGDDARILSAALRWASMDMVQSWKSRVIGCWSNGRRSRRRGVPDRAWTAGAHHGHSVMIRTCSFPRRRIRNDICAGGETAREFPWRYECACIDWVRFLRNCRGAIACDFANKPDSIRPGNMSALGPWRALEPNNAVV